MALDFSFQTYAIGDWPIPDEKIFAEVEEKACLHKALPGCCV